MTSACKLTLEAYQEQHSVFWHLLPLFGWEHTGTTDPHTPPTGRGPGVLQEFSAFTFLSTILHIENSAFLCSLLRSILHSWEAEAPGLFCLTTVSVWVGSSQPCTQRRVQHKDTDMKCSGQRDSDQLADRRAKGLVPSNMSEDSICCFFLEHVLGTQTSCKRSSGLQEEDFTEQKRAKAGSPCQQQHAGETTRKADAGNPERSISKRCYSYTASSLRHGYLATSLCSEEVLL